MQCIQLSRALIYYHESSKLTTLQQYNTIDVSFATVGTTTTGVAEHYKVPQYCKSQLLLCQSVTSMNVTIVTVFGKLALRC
jgi:hypothetical protein